MRQKFGEVICAWALNTTGRVPTEQGKQARVLPINRRMSTMLVLAVKGKTLLKVIAGADEFPAEREDVPHHPVRFN
jgi:hypothetical protein